LAGEHGLAAHVRQAARALVDELARVP
jgi:hypothetical protein